MSLGYDVTGDKRYGPDWPIRIFGIINGASIKGYWRPLLCLIKGTKDRR